MTIDLNTYFDSYQDRGIKKWTGFFLSEHTAQIAKEKEQSSKTYPQKRQMTENEIGQIFEFAFNNNRQVAVQLEMTDIDGKYFKDTIGFIKEFDELGYLVGDTKVHYDEIRNVELYDFKKWSDVHKE